MTPEMHQKAADAWAGIVTRAWREPSFKMAPLADPAATLAELGVTLPTGVKLVAVENTADRVHVVLPAKPSAALSESDLDKVAGGVGPLALGILGAVAFAAVFAMGVGGYAAAVYQWGTPKAPKT